MMRTAPVQAGENVRREHARGVGADVVVGIFRLVKLTQVHDLENEAMHRQIEETERLVREYCLQAGADVNVLFARRAVFLAGQLLRGSRADYESATELGEIFERLGGAELTVTRDVTGDDLRSFAEAVGTALAHGRPFRSPSPRIRLREVTAAARVRGLEVETLDYEQRLVRTYASAVVVMRRFFEQLARGDYSASRHLKRIAQTLADLSAGPTMAFLGVTEARNANHDEAGRAANSAILAVATTRQITDDRATLAQVAMAAMVQDVGRPRAAASNAAGPRMTAVTARLTDEQEEQLPAGTAAVLTALGRLNDATVTRTVVAYEALWLRRRTLGAVYGGARRPVLQARIVAIARRYNDLLTPEPGVEPLSSDRALATLQLELPEPTDRTVLRALAAALGLFPVGTVVQLSTGEVGEVVASGPRRAPERPRVRVAVDASGGAVDTPYEVDLDAPAGGRPDRHIARVVSVDGWRKALVPSARPRMTSDAPSVPSVSVPSVSTVQPVAHDPGPISSQPPRSSPITMPEAARPSVPPPLKLRTPLSPIVPANVSAPASAPSTGVERTIVQRSPFEDDSDQQPTRAVPSPLREAPPSRPAPVPAGVPRKVLVRTRDPHDDANATARGTLASTPLVHVLVYVLDHGLSGMVTLREPDEVTSTIAFGAGAPEKVRSGRPIARLGEILSAHGLVPAERAAAEAETARRMGRLIGEVLLSRGGLSRESLDWALRRQVVEKLARLANLSGDTRYSFHRDVNALRHWPTVESFPANPLEAILACVRAWENRAHIHDTLARFSSRRLSLHPAATVAQFDMTEEEQALVDAIRREEPTFADVQRRRGAPDDVAASLVYALTVTRHLVVPGQNRGPMGLELEEHVSADGDRLTPLSPLTPPPVSVRQPQSAPPVTVPSPAPPSVAPIPSPSPSRAAPPSARRPEPPAPPPVELSEDEDAEAERALRAMEDMRLAEAAFQRGETATAQRLAEKALASTPEDSDVRALVAWLRSIGGQADAVAESLAELGRILDEDPAHERSLLYRGRVYKRAGKARDAARDFEALLDVNPRHSEAASELRLLRSKKR